MHLNVRTFHAWEQKYTLLLTHNFEVTPTGGVTNIKNVFDNVTSVVNGFMDLHFHE